ncbi:MAG: hypothetical protein JSR42_04935 [Proteobacteria bacterium]|nr:hypothetical protein [Pseudomonadota bacterium]MBS0550943.1 hypothetical protein [Pseudomonadota bacterium]
MRAPRAVYRAGGACSTTPFNDAGFVRNQAAGNTPYTSNASTRGSSSRSRLCGTPDIAALLIERGADVLASRRDGERAITLAWKLGDERLVHLIEFKIDEQAKTRRPSA